MDVKFEIRWPSKGDNPFPSKSENPNSKTWCSLDWMANFNIDDSSYAEAFKSAGDKIISELARGEDVIHPDMYFFPIVYLYRHCLELKMKEIIRLGAVLELISQSKKMQEVLDSHNLHALWNKVKATITKYWPNGPKDELLSAEKIILDFHKVDEDGQTVRYSRDKKGNRTIDQMPSSVQLLNLKDVFEAIYNFLDGCEEGLEDGRQTRNEMMQDFGGYM